MKNIVKGRNTDPQTKNDDGGNHKADRGILSLGHAFYNQYKSDKDKEQRQKKNDGNWVKAGAIAAVFYTATTLVILAVNAYQASISRDTERRQLRAYIGIGPGDVIGFGTPTQKLRITRRNYGLTPALEVGFSGIGFAVVGSGEPIPFEGGCKFHDQKQSLVTMFPGADLKFELRLVDTKYRQSDIDDVMAGKKSVVFFGTACYKDTFGEVHHTNYCWMHSGPTLTAAEAEACLAFNDAD